jgi:hypothetical protein
MTRVQASFPQKNAYWTEGGFDVTAPDYTTDWTRWSSTFRGILRNWTRCIVSWNLVLDESGKPNIGPFSCGGVVTLNSKSHELTRRGQYWAFAAIQSPCSVVLASLPARQISRISITFQCRTRMEATLSCSPTAGMIRK